MIAMGVTGSQGYLSDMWNRFDFLIVIVSLIDLLPFNLTGGLNSLRAFRALRPLRAVTKVTCSDLILPVYLTASETETQGENQYDRDEF